MASALGTSSQRDRGIRIADIRDFGARPQGGTAAASSTRAAIQAAHDYLRDSAPNTAVGGYVYIPAGDWYIDRPVFFDAKQIKIRGEGPQESRIIGCAASHDLLVFGVARKRAGVAMTSDHLVDAFTGGAGGTPILDASAVTAVNQRWGLRTKADSHISQQGGPLDACLGDYYATTRQLTLDFLIDLTNAPGTGQFPSSGCVMGLTEHGVSSPWEILIRSNTFQVVFRTSEGVFDVGTQRSFTFYNIPTTPGVIRVSLQIDLINAVISAWINGQQVALANVVNTNFTAGANLSFLPNQHCPFGLGSNALNPGSVTDYAGSAIDCTFYGLKLTAGLLYQNLGTGTTQVRIDGQTLNDFWRYFKVEGSATIALFPLTDSPAQVTVDRVITVGGGFCGTTAYFIGSGTFDIIGGGEIRDLSVACWQAQYGRPVTIGASLDMRIANCDFSGGAYGLASFTYGATYPINISNCRFSGNDTALYLYGSSSVWINNIFLTYFKRAGIRAVETDMMIKGVFSPNYNTSDYTIKVKGGWLDLEHGVFDNEDNIGGATIASIYVSPSAFNPIDAVVNLRNVTAGSMGLNASFLILDDGIPEDGDGARHCSLSMDNIFLTVRPTRSVVRTNGSRWAGRFRAESSLQRPFWVENTAGANNNIVAEHQYFNGPPRDGTWTRNTNILTINNPAIGQFSEFRCVVDGSYGTATPPQWLGRAPIDDGLGLAAYVSDHSFWSAAGSPGGAQGFWNNGCHTIGLNAYFGGPMPTPPVSTYLSLNTRIGNRTRYASEVSGTNGYARVAVPSSSWATSSGGIVTNVVAISFPTATGTWARGSNPDPIASVVLYDAATGTNNLATCDIANLVVTNGVKPTFAIGSLALTQAAASAQGSFATRVHDVLNNFWLKGQTFTPPTIYLALSTGVAIPGSPPTEPSGGGYTRIAVSAGGWTLAPNAAFDRTGATGTQAVIRNATTMTFPAPTAAWGTVKSVYLMDASSGGNVLAAANLTVSRTIASGDPARSFAPGALWICRS